MTTDQLSVRLHASFVDISRKSSYFPAYRHGIFINPMHFTRWNKIPLPDYIFSS